jgi:broad specificity phosphatase PhoE
MPLATLLVSCGGETTGKSMKNVRLVRHGESAANAGAVTLDHASIPLTEKGIEQAKRVAQSVSRAPELIIASPFSRARATARATITIFPDAPSETWPIEEFTYLDPTRCVDTTVGQRKAWVDHYWANADPSYIDGEGAESFLEFVGRARSFLDDLATHPAQDILVFSHGQFLNAVAWLIERKPLQVDAQAMIDWRRYEIDNHVRNCGYVVTRALGDSSWSVSDPVDIDGAVDLNMLQARLRLRIRQKIAGFIAYKRVDSPL